MILENLDDGYQHSSAYSYSDTNSKNNDKNIYNNIKLFFIDYINETKYAKIKYNILKGKSKITKIIKK